MTLRKFRQLTILLLLATCAGMASLRTRGTLPVTLLDSWKEIRNHADPIRPVVYDVPKVASTEPFDGVFNWKQPAFRVGAMHPDRLSRKDGTLAAAASMAWAPEGLLLEIRVHGQPHLVRQKACLNSSEINFDFAWGNGGEEGYQVTVRDPDLPESQLFVLGKDDRTKPPVKMTRRTEADGYSIKLLAPLPAEASKGLRLRTAVADTDGKTLDALQLWEPCAPEDAGRLPLLRPADAPSEPLLATSFCHPALLPRKENYLSEVRRERAGGRSLHQLVAEGTGADRIWSGMLARSGYRLTLNAPASFSGRQIAIVDDRSNHLGSATAIAGNQDILVPNPKGRNAVSSLSVFADKTKLSECAPSFERGRAAIETSSPVDMVFASYVFDGPKFPEPYVVDPIGARWAMGAFGIDAHYYDSAFRAASAPSVAGRYGAVATVKQGEKELSTQFRTFAYRVPLKPDSGTDIPRMSADEKRALNALASNVARVNTGYEAFDEDQAWWLTLRERLGIDIPWVTVLPPDYDAKSQKKWPVVLYLHGGGAQELEGLRARVETETVTRVATGEIGPFKAGAKTPFILVEPLLSIRDLRWTPALVESVLRQAKRNFKIDPHRVILTGHSAGASGALRVAETVPDRFSAMLLLSFEPSFATRPERLRKLPAWFFVGDKDPSTVAMDGLSRSIASVGGKSRMTVLKDAEHYIPPLVYTRGDVWRWALGQG